METKGNPAYQILVVDDEPSVGRAITLLLKHDGHTVRAVESAAAALELFEPGKFDLVMTDYAMRDMKGDALATVLKQRQPGLPILMVSAFADDLTSGGKRMADVDLLLNKPFSLAQLREAVAQAMQKKSGPE